MCQCVAAACCSALQCETHRHTQTHTDTHRHTQTHHIYDVRSPRGHSPTYHVAVIFRKKAINYRGLLRKMTYRGIIWVFATLYLRSPRGHSPMYRVALQNAGAARCWHTLQHTATAHEHIADTRAVLFLTVLGVTLRCNTLQHTATHCITWQHTATHGNTLQHTATTHGHITNTRRVLVVRLMQLDLMHFLFVVIATCIRCLYFHAGIAHD